MAARPINHEPLPRSEHAAFAVRSQLHLWSGWAGSKKKSRELVQGVDIFDIGANLWEQKPTPAPERWNSGIRDTGYTVVEMCLYSFGGWDGVFRYNSLHKLDLYTWQWEEVQVSNPSSGPQKKNGCRMVSYRDSQLVVSAGRTDDGKTGELHVFNLDIGEHIKYS